LPACPPSLARHLRPVPHDAFIRDGVFSTLRRDLVWTPQACTPQVASARAWLTSKYGPYTDAPALLDRDVQCGATTAPNPHALVWLWPLPCAIIPAVSD
jgi:hypothetical protein